MQLIRLKEILTEGRSESLSFDEARKIFYSNCKEFSKDNTTIYRGVDFNSKYGIVRPKKFERSSAYTDDYYSIIVDNLDSWDRYPDRSKSVVCSTSELDASRYGELFIVIPFDYADIAIAPAEDFWLSFDELPMSLNEFNEALRGLSVKLVGNEPVDYDYKSLMGSIKELDEKIKEEYDGEMEILRDDELVKTEIKLAKYSFQSYMGIFGKIEEWFDPEKNGFQIKEYKSGFSAPSHPDKREIYTDSPCLLISYDHFQTFYQNL